MSSVMHSSYHPQSHPVDAERGSSAQDKAMLQRQYRANEKEALAQLQKSLRDITRSTDNLTRLETIVKATEVIKHLHRRLKELQKSPYAQPDDSAAVFNSHPAQVHQLPDWPWLNDFEFNATDGFSWRYV
ncbi:uncharacterized protein EDB91DRAFT_1079305 [Suillus paluster]|uniref:uncharacterized protein n=1 Tax=Suillus paluster TaxID=48578 RepID=UPI001B85E8B4|nr:uncharacterized protein EDB91DRAFT_1079305 [Suillus paluster]KAG1748321.1 hypothetical protein EDB91DRAFT_1079305 [Suillus paluster]